MKSRPEAAAPFEVSRSVIFTDQKHMAFSGRVALTALRDQWYELQELSDSLTESVDIPQESAMRAVLLYREETDRALLIGRDSGGLPVYNEEQAREIARRIEEVKSDAEFPVTPLTSVMRVIDSHRNTSRLILPFVMQEAGAAAEALQAERAQYLEILRDVTGKDTEEPFDAAIPIAQLPPFMGIAEAEMLRTELQMALWLAGQDSGSRVRKGHESLPLGDFVLGPPEIVV